MSDPQQPGQPYDHNQPNPYGQQGPSGQPGQPEPQYGQPGQQGNPYAQQGQSQQGWPGQDQYGQNPYGAGPGGGPGGQGGGSKKGLWITLISIAAVIVVALGAFLGIRAFTHKDEPINADPTPSVQSSDASPAPSTEQSSPSEESSPSASASSDDAFGDEGSDAATTPSSGSDLSFSERERITELGVSELKQQMDLPKRMDEVTVLRDVKAESVSIHYFYDVDKSVSASQVNRSTLRSTVAKQVCANSQSRRLLDEGIRMRYSYTIEGKVDAVNFSIEDSDC